EVDGAGRGHGTPLGEAGRGREGGDRGNGDHRPGGAEAGRLEAHLGPGEGGRGDPRARRGRDAAVRRRRPAVTCAAGGGSASATARRCSTEATPWTHNTLPPKTRPSPPGAGSTGTWARAT